MQMGFSIPAWDSVKCSRCHEFKDWNGGKGWNGRQCPECKREYRCQYRVANPEAANLECSQCHEFKDWNGGDGWRGRHCPECHRANAANWYYNNLERAKRKRREIYERNIDAKKEYDRRRHAANPTRGSNAVRQWRIDNPGKHKIKARRDSRNRRARKSNAICEHGPGCFDRAAQSMPQRCSIHGCRRRKHIQADHIIPLAKGGLDCKDNLQPLCSHHTPARAPRTPSLTPGTSGSCFRHTNRNKGGEDPIEWANRHGRLL